MCILYVFFSSKCSLCHNPNWFGSCFIHILYTGCVTFKKYIYSGAKRLNSVSLLLSMSDFEQGWALCLNETKEKRIQNYRIGFRKLTGIDLLQQWGEKYPTVREDSCFFREVHEDGVLLGHYATNFDTFSHHRFWTISPSHHQASRIQFFFNSLPLRMGSIR